MNQSPATSPAKAGEQHSATKAASLWLGLAVVSAAVLWQGIGTAVVGRFVEPELGTFTTFTAFLSASMIALLLSRFSDARRSGKNAANSLKPVDWLKLNLVTAGAFACFYVSATMIPATAASVIETGLGPIAVALTMFLFHRGVSARTLLHPMAVLLAAAAAAWFVFAAQKADNSYLVLGIGLSTAAGLCATGVLLVSRQLAERGISASAMSVARFHLAWVLCGLLSLPSLLAGTTEMSRLLGVAALSVLAISAPILLLQWGITLAKPLHSAIIISALPAVVLATDTLLGAALTGGIAAAMGVLVAVLLLGLRRVPKRK